MKDLIIVGAGGFARELLQWVKDINKVNNRLRIKGFIDDNADALNGIECDYSIIGSIETWQPSANEVYALAIAAPKTKEIVANKLKSRGAVFTEIIHPTAVINEFAKYGEGLVMYPFSSLGPNSVTGDFVTVLISGVPHDAVVEDYVTISSYCGLTRGVHIGKRAFIASNASVLPERTIGEDAYIGIGSVVIRNVGKGKKVFGNPAKTVDL